MVTAKTRRKVVFIKNYKPISESLSEEGPPEIWNSTGGRLLRYGILSVREGGVGLLGYWPSCHVCFSDEGRLYKMYMHLVINLQQQELDQLPEARSRSWAAPARAGGKVRQGGRQHGLSITIQIMTKKDPLLQLIWEWRRVGPALFSLRLHWFNPSSRVYPG